mgnify:CR=1 FL=1|tara:strand:+ start:132 stop:785 length:654 start_codon:yes stop_codon:yes gene_type:complete
MNKRNILFLITGFSVILTFANNLGLYTVRGGNYGESFFEHTQAFIIFISLIYLISSRKYIVQIYGKFCFYFKGLLLIFLLYEELSFLTKRLCKICDSFNSQAEFNLHNIEFLNSTKFLNIPIFELNISLMLLIYLSFIFILSWGNYFPISKRIKGIFFERKYAFFSSLYIIELTSNWILSTLGIISYNENLLHSEYIELIFYLTIFFDLIDKKFKKI